MKQKNNKSILDHSHLKQAKEILEAHASKEVLMHYIENRSKFDK